MVLASAETNGEAVVIECAVQPDGFVGNTATSLLLRPREFLGSQLRKRDDRPFRKVAVAHCEIKRVRVGGDELSPARGADRRGRHPAEILIADVLARYQVMRPTARV